MDKTKSGIDKLSSDDFIDLYNYSRLTEVKESVFGHIEKFHQKKILPYEEIIDNYIIEKYANKTENVLGLSYLVIRNLFEDGLISWAKNESRYYYALIKKSN